MGWVTLFVEEANGNSQQDGYVKFSWSTTGSGSNLQLNSGATLSYKPNANANGTQLFTTSKSYSLQNGVFTIDDQSISPNVTIPPVPGYVGGTYNELTDITFDPTTDAFQATFHRTSPAGDDPDCSWTATVSTGLPKPAKHAKKASH
jgi:hypothetical protein